MKANELRDSSVDDLKKELESLLKEQFSLRMQRGSQQLTKPHLLGDVRRNIARVKTVMHEKASEKS